MGVSSRTYSKMKAVDWVGEMTVFAPKNGNEVMAYGQ